MQVSKLKNKKSNESRSMVFSRLEYSAPDQAVQVQAIAGDIGVIFFWRGGKTLYSQCLSLPRLTSGSRNIPSHSMPLKLEISSILMVPGWPHLAGKETFEAKHCYNLFHTIVPINLSNLLPAHELKRMS